MFAYNTLSAGYRQEEFQPQKSRRRARERPRARGYWDWLL